MIYCVEDDTDIREIETYTLRSLNLQAEGFPDGKSFFEAVERELPELVILDVMLPDMDGVEILRRLRRTARTRSIPVIMATAKGAEYERVGALDAGADDYLTKPFQPAELMARLRALTRRQGELVVDEQTAGDLKLGLSTSELSCNGKTVTLSYKEFELMRLFMSNLAQTLPKETLIARVWGVDSDADDNNVEAYISFLRKKLKYLGSSAQIVTQRKVGYRLEAPAGE